MKYFDTLKIGLLMTFGYLIIATSAEAQETTAEEVAPKPIMEPHPPEIHRDMGLKDPHGKQVLGKHWKESLTDKQRITIDKMHLELSKKKSALIAKMALAKTELALLATKEVPSMSAINKKIDQIVRLKRRSLRLRYTHVIEMRKQLTKDQRVSYDMGVLRKTHRNKHHRRPPFPSQ